MAREKCVAGSNPVLLLGPDRVIKTPSRCDSCNLTDLQQIPFDQGPLDADHFGIALTPRSIKRVQLPPRHCPPTHTGTGH